MEIREVGTLSFFVGAGLYVRSRVFVLGWLGVHPGGGESGPR